MSFQMAAARMQRMAEAIGRRIARSLPRPKLSPAQLAAASPQTLKSIVARSGLFDARYYLAQLAGDRETVRDPVAHYLAEGESQGRMPNPVFDPAWYRQAAGAALPEKGSPLAHYVLSGSGEGRETGPDFDAGYYRKAHADVAAAGIEPMRHYLEFGRYEGRAATAASKNALFRHFDITRHDRLGPLASPTGSSGRLPLSEMAEGMRGRGRQVLLHILHSSGGGTERHVADLARSLPDVSHLVLAPRRTGGIFELSVLVPEDGGWRRADISTERFADVAPLLRQFGVSRVHVHHAVEVIDGIEAFLAGIAAPYDLTLHDYSLICPRMSLVRDGQYCGEPDESGCRSCLSRQPTPHGRDIVAWRGFGTSLLRNADRVICPTIDVATRLRRYVPDARIVVAPHEAELYHPAGLAPWRAADPVEQLRVAVIGACAEHKGGAFLLDCIEQARAARSPVSWTAIGFFPGSLAGRARDFRDVLDVTGPYDGARVGDMIQRTDPHVIFFPQHCVETYSYSLSEALASRRQILAPRIGPFAERLAGIEGARLYNVTDSPAEVVEVLRGLRPGAKPPPFQTPPGLEPDLGFYQSDYLHPRQDRNRS